MECSSFGLCGSCSEFKLPYKEQLEAKKSRVEELFSDLYDGEIEIFSSKDSGYRARAEFKIYHTDNSIYYAMSGFDKSIVKIDSCKIVQESIEKLLNPLLEQIKSSSILRDRLRNIELLSSNQDEILLTLIYHKKLETQWEKSARELEKRFGIYVVGRSKKCKIVLSKEFVDDRFDIGGVSYVLSKFEGSFSQPNSQINEKMVNWTLKKSAHFSGDLLELYCGHGNFTLFLSNNFQKVLATEVSKSALGALDKNIRQNGVKNISCVRLSGEEVIEALEFKREFYRIKQKEISLKDYDFKTIFVDPPRAGAGESVCRFMQRFENIIYISCNPTTLREDMEILKKSHKIEHLAIFDQFPHTKHIECGVVLKSIKEH